MQEALSATATLGVVLIGSGVVAMGIVAKTSRPSLLFAGAAAVFIASYTLIDGTAVRRAGASLPYVLWLTAVQGAVFAVGAALVRGRRIAPELRARWKTSLLAGVFSGGGYAVALWAMEQAPIALVAALRETSVVFAALLAVAFLKESLGVRRIVAATVVALGAAFVRFG